MATEILLGEALPLSSPKPTCVGCSTRGDYQDKVDDFLCCSSIFHPEWPGASYFRNAAKPRAMGASRKKANEHEEVLKDPFKRTE